MRDEGIFFSFSGLHWLEGGRFLWNAPRPPLSLHVEGGGGARSIFWQQPRGGAGHDRLASPVMS